MTAQPPPKQQREEPDPELCTRFHSGDSNADDELFVLLHREVLRFCGMILGDEDAACEALQETYLRIMERRRLYDPRRPFRPWLFATARNVCLSALRRRKTAVARIVEFDSEDDAALRVEATEPDAMQRLMREQSEQAVSDALRSIDENSRLIVVMHAVEEMSFREIAEQLGRSANTVATQYYRAIRRLQTILLSSDCSPKSNGSVRHGS